MSLTWFSAHTTNNLDASKCNNYTEDTWLLLPDCKTMGSILFKNRTVTR